MIFASQPFEYSVIYIPTAIPIGKEIIEVKMINGKVPKRT